MGNQEVNTVGISHVILWEPKWELLKRVCALKHCGVYLNFIQYACRADNLWCREASERFGKGLDEIPPGAALDSRRK